MSLTNAPAVITQLATQLAACATWPAGTTTWYPTKPDGTAPPFAVLSEESRHVAPYAAGAAGIAGGVLQAVLHVADTIGNVETVARTLLDDLLGQVSGLVFSTGECGVSSEPTPGEIAAGINLVAINLTLPWGLNV